MNNKAWFRFIYEIALLTATVYAIAFLLGQVQARSYLKVFAGISAITVAAGVAGIYQKKQGDRP